MTELKANALPRKRFFVEMFTRDISLMDCILDLIDNSIDDVVVGDGLGNNFFDNPLVQSLQFKGY